MIKVLPESCNEATDPTQVQLEGHMTKKTLGDIWKTAEFFSQIDLCLLKEDPIIS